MPQSFFDYEYTELKDNERQYDDIDFAHQIGVPARYVRLDSDAGNPFIEALPRPRAQDELSVAGSKGINGYFRENELQKSTINKALSILKLREVRYPLPMNYELENEVYSALILSYRARHMFRDECGDIRVEYEAKNNVHSSDGVLVGTDASATNAGISLIGYSGCGKSSALQTLFSNYPQYIIHRGEGLTTYPQIVYLVVQCPPHSNFRGLYKNIGVAIDRALGNVKPVYELELDAGERGNLSRYRDKVRILIEKFSIGIIIFDEIQHLSFDVAVENSFESILELANQTKVAFGVVGTEDAYVKLFGKNLRQTRRLGPEIHADKYCQNIRLFSFIANKLFEYQWFDDIVTPTEEIIDAMYQCTHGIIDQIIGLYMFMNLDYVRAKKKPTVNADYVKKTAERHYPGMQEILQDLGDVEAEGARTQLAKKANDEIDLIISEERSKAAETAALKALADDELSKMVTLKQYCVSRIMEVEDSYNSATIERAFDQIVGTKRGKELVLENSATKLTQLVNKKLRDASTSDRRPAAKNKTRLAPASIKSYLGLGEEQESSPT